MATSDDNARASYLIPPRTICGSLEEMLAQIDEIVLGLLALRQLIAVQGTADATGMNAARAALRLVPRGINPASR